MLKKKTPLSSLLEKIEQAAGEQVNVYQSEIVLAVIGHTTESAAKCKKGIKVNTAKLPSTIDFMRLIMFLRNNNTIPVDDPEMPEIISLNTDKKTIKAEAKRDAVEARIDMLLEEGGLTIARLTALFTIMRYIREKKIKMRIFIGTAVVLAAVGTVIAIKLISDKKNDDFDEEIDDVDIDDPDDDNILDIDDDELDMIDGEDVEVEDISEDVTDSE